MQLPSFPSSASILPNFSSVESWQEQRLPFFPIGPTVWIFLSFLLLRNRLQHCGAAVNRSRQSAHVLRPPEHDPAPALPAKSFFSFLSFSQKPHRVGAPVENHRSRLQGGRSVDHRGGEVGGYISPLIRLPGETRSAAVWICTNIFHRPFSCRFCSEACSDSG